MLIKRYNECSICFEQITNSSKTYKSNFSIGEVCENCSQVFSPEQREIIIHTFNTVRGIFDVTENNIIIVKDVLYDIQSDLKIHKKESFSEQSLFQKILLRAQIYRLKLNNFFATNFQYSKELLNQPSCEICHKSIRGDFNDENYKSVKGNICENCNLKFSVGEKLTMIALFKKYGGFFNKIDFKTDSLKQIIDNLFKNLEKEKDFSKMIELNEKSLHLALLFGYTPNAFIKELKKIL
ncbi:MAG: hypothetical protein ACFFCV_11805 [Promethearchaeota archaeon]